MYHIEETSFKINFGGLSIPEIERTGSVVLRIVQGQWKKQFPRADREGPVGVRLKLLPEYNPQGHRECLASEVAK